MNYMVALKIRRGSSLWIDREGLFESSSNAPVPAAGYSCMQRLNHACPTSYRCGLSILRCSFSRMKACGRGTSQSALISRGYCVCESQYYHCACVASSQVTGHRKQQGGRAMPTGQRKRASKDTTGYPDAKNARWKNTGIFF
jgi:hypothetical protein